MTAPYRIQVSLIEDNTWPFYMARHEMHLKVKEYKDWCAVNVGANNWNYYGYEKKRPFEFRFKKQEDLLAFRLRFGI